MIEKYIAELLETNNRVIVPDFGAFMVKMDAGKRAVTFNDFLKYNDGLLVNHMASKEKISKDDAFKKIREFVKELQQTLKTTQKYSIASLGTLVKDERGGVRFLAGEDTPATESPAKTEAPAEISAPEVTKTEAPKVESEAPKAETKVEDKSQPKPTASVNTPPTPGQKPGQAQPTPQAKPTVKPGTPPPPPPGKGPVTVAKKPEQKGNMATILIVVGVVVVLGVLGGLIYLNYDEWFGKAEKERLAQEAQRKEQIRLDSIAQAERMDSIRFAEEEAARQAQILKNQKKYYLVAGSFKVEKNAHRFAEQLKSQGYNSEVFMESRGFWRVSYSSFIERKEAFAEYQKLKQKEIQVWVIRH